MFSLLLSNMKTSLTLTLTLPLSRPGPCTITASAGYVLLPGRNTCLTLTLAEEHGANFLLLKNNQLVSANMMIGAKDSTFLGMREISAASALLGAEVGIYFEPNKVVSSVSLPVQRAEGGQTQRGQPLDSPTVTLRNGWELTFIICDDDKVSFPSHCHSCLPNHATRLTRLHAPWLGDS